jgi:NAD(P)-dependent dehydrogenase (short-subunit alcohol dehydrogenase family)
MVAEVPQNILDGLIESIPVGRLGRPDEVARAVCFLLHDDSGYITGSVLAVNGGLEM